jgi:UDP-galactopyranose mutase
VKVDYLIVGSGLTGATISRLLADAGREVLVVDRRSHWGGNVHDHTHESGIRIHTYGPHYFRTSSEHVWDYVNRFAEFYPFEAVVQSLVDGRYENWPIAASYIRTHIGEGWRPEFQGTPSNFEEAALSLMPRTVYEKFVKEYSEKQWGIPVHQLAASLCKRFDVRADDDPRLTPKASHQGLPKQGYSELMRRMLEDLPLQLNFDYMQRRGEIVARKLLVFTGPIDELFEFALGRLAYRGQQRAHRYLPDVDFAQPVGQVNNPLHTGGAHIRTLEWKHMMPDKAKRSLKGTVLTTETPFTPQIPNAYEYPLPDGQNANLYADYRRRADATEGLLVCGRLGEYRYYDMDQAIGAAMTLAGRVLGLAP